MRKLAILGAGGHGKVIADTAEVSDWQDIVFFDDILPAHTKVGPWSIEGNTEAIFSHFKKFDGIIVGIGDNMIRWQKYAALRDLGANMPILIHPNSWVSPYAQVGAGTIVAGGCIINIDAILGEACIVNTGATIDHDCILGDAVHISPGAHLGGNILVGNRTWVGLGASIRQELKIGESVIIGAGAVVVKSISDGFTVIGNPAKPLIKNNHA